jgi:SAM-dependent methyltransferase
MSKESEKNYPLAMGATLMDEVARKPFAGPDCAESLCRIAAVLSLLPATPARVLDLGCGTGWTSAFLAKRGHDVVGVDIAPEMVRLAERLRRQEGLDNLRFQACDFEDASFDGTFDAVVFFDALHHAEDEEAALRAAYRALRPGGRCVASEPGEGHADEEHSREAVARYGVTEKDMPPHRIMDVGAKVGFQRIYTYPHTWDNRRVDYSVDERHRLRGRRIYPDPMGRAGPLKWLFHRMVRWRFRLTREAYAALLNMVPQLGRQIGMQGMLRSGIVVMEK